MVTLEKDWAGLVDLVVEFAAGGFGAFDVVVHLHTVEGEGDFVADDGCLGCLPLVARLGDEFVWRFDIVDGTVAIVGVRAASVVAEDLNFVASTEIEAAVGFVGNHEVKFDGEVPEFLVGDEVVAVKVLVGDVLEDAVFDGPTIAAVRVAEVPTGGVFAIEERTEAFFVSSEGTES